MSEREEIRGLQDYITRMEKRLENLERRNVLPVGFRFVIRNGVPQIIDTATGSVVDSGPVSGAGLFRHDPPGAGVTSDTITAAQPAPVGSSTLALHVVSSTSAATLDGAYAALYSNSDTMTLGYRVGTTIPATVTVGFAGATDQWMHGAPVVHNIGTVRSVSASSTTTVGPHTFPQLTALDPGEVVIYLAHTAVDGTTSHVIQPPTENELWPSTVAAPYGDLGGWWELTTTEGLTEPRQIVLDAARRMWLTTLLCTAA